MRWPASIIIIVVPVVVSKALKAEQDTHAKSGVLGLADDGELPPVWSEECGNSLSPHQGPTLRLEGRRKDVQPLPYSPALQLA